MRINWFAITRRIGRALLCICLCGVAARLARPTVVIEAQAATGRDLLVTTVSDPPGMSWPGGAYVIGDTTTNQGMVLAGTSTTRFYLSMDAVKDSADKLLTGFLAVPSLGTGQSSGGQTTVTVPAGLVPGQYFQLACADDKQVVVESNELNNCVASAGRIQIVLPDLVETVVSGLPASVVPGQKLTVTDTVINQGQAPAAATTTRYYLSVDGAWGTGDVPIVVTRAVATLGAGATSSGSKTATIPATIPLGTYFLLACGDDVRKVVEANEANNCVASAKAAIVGLPDLVETAVGNPPTVASPGQTMTLTDSVANQGTASSGASTTRYYLSVDGAWSGTDVLMSVTRAVPALTPGQNSAAGKTVTIPATIPTGTYYALACADDLKKVSEFNDGNNCAASTTAVVVALPDLVEMAVSGPPVFIAPGQTISVTDRVLNRGPGPAGASSTRYYLSADGAWSAGDVLLGSRSVPVLAIGGTSFGSRTVGIPAATPIGTYYALACADDLSRVTEAEEGNNCVTLVGVVVINPSPLTLPPILESTIGLKVSYVGSMPVTNATSPVRAGSSLVLIDQRGTIYRRDDNGVTSTLLTPADAPSGLNLVPNEQILNVASNAAADTIYVTFTSATTPPGTPVSTSSRGNDNAYQVVYAYDFDGASLSNPRPLRSFEVNRSGHTGGGLAVADDGSILLVFGDNGDNKEDGRSFAQDSGTHLSKLVRIDPITGAATTLATGFRNPQRLDISQHGGQAYLSLVDIGGSIAEELDAVPLAEILDPSSIENFGWGRNAVDGLAREGTVYIDASGNYVANAPPGEAGFVQPIAEWGRPAPGQFAGTGSISCPSLTRISFLFGDLPTGDVYALEDWIPGSPIASVLRVHLFDASLNPTSLSGLAGGRPDPRFFCFPDGSAGVLLEDTGNYYRLDEIAIPSAYPFALILLALPLMALVRAGTQTSRMSSANS